MQDTLEQKAIQEMIKLADSKNKVTALCRGNDPEESNHIVFYFLIEDRFDEEFSDQLSDLDLRIANEIGYQCDLMEWPCSVEKINEHPFLGKCIWKRG
ncbi:MAG: hypothetical protein AABX54_03605 [Nanoarchaeota archaeon]